MADTLDAARDEAAAEDDARRLDRLTQGVTALLDDGDEAAAAEAARPLHAADLADLLERLPREARERLADLLSPGLDPEVLPHLDAGVRGELIGHLGPETVGALVAELASDDAVDVLSQLESSEAQAAILKTLPRLDRATIERGLQFPEDSAGRLMQREFVAVPTFWTVGRTIDYLRESRDLPEDFHALYLVDPRYRPVGVVAPSAVLRSGRDTALSDLTVRDLHPIRVETDQEEVGFLFRKYGLTSAPVVNERGRLLGVVTVDDAIDVITEEAEEDQLKRSGVLRDDLYASPWRTVRQRVPWLLVNLVTAVLASAVISRFEATIERVVALAVLMPIVASMGGNAGGQTLAVVVRALATHEITSANALRILLKEAAVGGMNGLAFLVVGVGLAVLWFQDPVLGLLFGAALVINLAAAALAGVLIPVALTRLRLDPAIASGVFLTTVTDVVGFFAFLGLASLYLT